MVLLLRSARPVLFAVGQKPMPYQVKGHLFKWGGLCHVGGCHGYYTLGLRNSTTMHRIGILVGCASRPGRRPASASRRTTEQQHDASAPSERGVTLPDATKASGPRHPGAAGALRPAHCGGGSVGRRPRPAPGDGLEFQAPLAAETTRRLRERHVVRSSGARVRDRRAVEQAWSSRSPRETALLGTKAQWSPHASDGWPATVLR